MSKQAKSDFQPEWTVFLDDDVYVSTDRFSRLLGALNDSIPIYALSAGVWGDCAKFGGESFMPKDFHKYVRKETLPGYKTPGWEQNQVPVWQGNGGAGHALSKPAMEAFMRLYTPRPGQKVIDVCIDAIQTRQDWQSSNSDLTLSLCYAMATVGIAPLWLPVSIMDQSDARCECCQKKRSTMTCHYWNSAYLRVRIFE